MAFNGTEGEVVTLNEASSWTANYRATIAEGETEAQFYGKDKIQAILNQEGCMGIRIYNGIDENNQKVLILVGADADENDMTGGDIVERGLKCPPTCGGKNALNS